MEDGLPKIICMVLNGQDSVSSSHLRLGHFQDACKTVAEWTGRRFGKRDLLLRMLAVARER